MIPMKIKIVTLGCPKNLVDSEYIQGMLKNYGVKIVNDSNLADMVIINTCGFIEPAKVESIEEIFKWLPWKNSNPNRKLIVTGCLTQRYKEEIKKEIPEIDLIWGNNNFTELIENLLKFNTNLYRIPKNNTFPRSITTPKSYAYLKIAEGCNNNCHYCSIPFIRGNYKSKPIEAILEEAEFIANSNYKELILIAQDLLNYGNDLPNKPDIFILLKELINLKKFHWIRLHYLYPSRLNKNLIDFIIEQPQIAKYLDIPFQHFNPYILKKMGRSPYIKRAINLIKYFKKALPSSGIRTSIIVGYPGEKREHFIELKKFLKELKFDYVGFFAFSPEEGTIAYNLKSRIKKRKSGEKI